MILVIGEVLIDLFDDYQRIGGAPFNFAFHLKQLGWPVRFLTRIGDDKHGRDILAMFERHGFNKDDVQIDSHHATGTVQVTLDSEGVPQFDIRGDVAYDHLDLAAFGPIDWASARVIYFGSLAQRTTGGFDRIQRFVTQRLPHTKVFCDINLRTPHVNVEAVRASLRQADIVKLNIEELTTIHGLLGGACPEKEAVDWLMRCFTVETVILTRGSQGSTIHTADQKVAAGPPERAHVVDTVGAGDAYAAVSAAGLMKGLPLKTVVEKASEFAAYICTLSGAVPEDASAYAMLGQRIKGSDHVA